jgi:signal transduction histidine kinase
LAAGVRAAEVLLDMGLLTGMWHLTGPRIGSWARRVVVVLLANTLACSAFAACGYFAVQRLGLQCAVHPTLLSELGDGLLASLSLFGLWMLGFRYPDLLRATHLRSLEAERLRARAELTQLRAHLQPHFLRNTLTVVAALVTEDPREARRLIAMLGDLLTESLESADSRQTLDDEVAWLKRYAAILLARHHGSLAFTWDIAPSVRRTAIPRLLLQPLVENAALHGALCRDGDGVVSIRASQWREGGARVVVEDNGPGFDPGSRTKGSLGLHLVKRRLELECPGAGFRIESSPDGTRAVLELP